MNLDDELRATLLARAEDAPNGVGTLDAVRGRARRIETRRRAGVVGAAAVVGVAAVIGAPYLLVPFRHAPGLSVGTPAATGSPSAAPSPSASSRPSTVALVAPAFTPVTFPLTPGWTPPGVDQPTVGRTQGLVRLVYLGPSTSLIAQVTAQSPQTDWTPSGSQQTRVGTRPATLATGTDHDGQPAVRITWQLSDGKWVDLESSGQISAAQLKQYADNLRMQPLPPAPLPFTLALAPQGFQPSYQELSPTEFHFCLAPPDQVDGDSTTWVCVSHNTSQLSGGEPVVVGTDQGEISKDGNTVQLTVHRPGFDFLVTADENGPLNREDLIRFAAGVVKA
jgi:hypothetical protein